jgi:CTP synthase
MTKYIFITGNIIETNKSIFVASLAALLKENNLKINIKKISRSKPITTFVTNNGYEVDFNLGHYERITEIITSEKNNISISQIYKNIKNIKYINKEIINFIELESNYYDIVLIESIDIYVNVIKYFFEKYNNVINIHLLSKQNLISNYIQPNIIINKYDYLKFMHTNIYKIPYLLFKLNFYTKILNLLQIQQVNTLTKWEKIYNDLSNLENIIYVYIIIKFSESYISLMESLKHASFFLKKNIKIIWLDPTFLTKEQMIDKLKEKKGGILVPGGFGEIGFENKIEAIKFARENNIPFLGICYGMQIMIIEYARNILNINNASTEEIDYLNPIVPIVNKSYEKRLGSHIIKIKQNSMADYIYKSDTIIERHRHKYKINTDYKNLFEKKGLIFTGMSLDNKYMEICEVPKKFFYIGVQYHPELVSTIFTPHPILVAFIQNIII